MVPNPNLIKNPANSTLPSKRKMSPIGPGKSAKKVNSVGSIPLYNRYMPLSDNDKSTTDQNKATTPDTAKPAVLYIRNVPMSTVVALITTAIKHKNLNAPIYDLEHLSMSNCNVIQSMITEPRSMHLIPRTSNIIPTE